MITIRPAEENDCKTILAYIKKLAHYEKAPEQVIVTESQLITDGFGESPLYNAYILSYNNNICGFALIYNRYSTWRGKSLYIEDIYVDEEFRGRGIGLLAFKHIAQIALDTKCNRMEWQVLDWNEPAINFYKKINASIEHDWLNCKIESKQILKKLIEM